MRPYLAAAALLALALPATAQAAEPGTVTISPGVEAIYLTEMRVR